MRLHLWYLSEDLTALPLFGNDVSAETKEAIVTALQQEPYTDDVWHLAPDKITYFREVSVADFVTSRSLSLFGALGLSQQFFKEADYLIHQ